MHTNGAHMVVLEFFTRSMPIRAPPIAMGTHEETRNQSWHALLTKPFGAAEGEVLPETPLLLRFTPVSWASAYRYMPTDTPGNFSRAHRTCSVGGGLMARGIQTMAGTNAVCALPSRPRGFLPWGLYDAHPCVFYGITGTPLRASGIPQPQT